MCFDTYWFHFPTINNKTRWRSLELVKLEFTPEQATKAQRGSRGIALLFP